MPARGTGLQLVPWLVVMLDLDDPAMMLSDMGCGPVDVGQYLWLLVMGRFHDPLLHIDDQ